MLRLLSQWKLADQTLGTIIYSKFVFSRGVHFFLHEPPTFLVSPSLVWSWIPPTPFSLQLSFSVGNIDNSNSNYWRFCLSWLIKTVKLNRDEGKGGRWDYEVSTRYTRVRCEIYSNILIKTRTQHLCGILFTGWNIFHTFL